MAMIKFDLHIHSFASNYKENADIVNDSNIENAEVLLERLNAENIGLFSITDHNRFWPELYERFDELLLEGKYPRVQGLVAGVEFDVRLNPEMAVCHIITIFDTKSQRDRYQIIYKAIENHKLTKQEDSYSKDEYEELLREIGMDVILIACQRTGLDRHDGKTRSLSGSTMEAEMLISSGYISALEFQRPNVEGILQNNLRDVPKHIMLISGSDCHEWKAYPYHDSRQKNQELSLPRGRIMPTFKGLLMAITSPETRINQQENRNREFFKSISVNDQEIPLVNGLIAIIGENGSGKSSIISILHGKADKTHIKRIKEFNNIRFSKTDISKQLIIEQGQIVDSFGQDNLFPVDNYIDIDHTSFRQAYIKFANDLLSFIKCKIKAKEAIEQLGKEELSYNELIHIASYYINVLTEKGFSEVDNPHAIHDKEVHDLIEEVFPLRSDEYYNGFQSEIDQILELLGKIYAAVHERYDAKVVEQKTKNHIVSAAVEYARRVEAASNSQQRDQRDYLNSREEFIGYIITAAKLNTVNVFFPSVPDPIRGCSANPIHGFSFNMEARYHNRSMIDDFLNRMFVNEYKSLDALRQIDNYFDLGRAVFRCGSVDQIDEQYQKNLSAFLDEMCKCRRYIVDTTQGESELGNTLGEMSLAYFKYLTERETEKTIFLIDQPEDHISNNNISKKLISYFNSIRSKKQIIMVTHNPLLVVNQDVDQVIYISKSGDKVQVVSGCLEYEDECTNILDIIARNMDGGKDSIEKRLKVYGKDNCLEHATQ